MESSTDLPRRHRKIGPSNREPRKGQKEGCYSVSYGKVTTIVCSEVTSLLEKNIPMELQKAEEPDCYPPSVEDELGWEELV